MREKGIWQNVIKYYTQTILSLYASLILFDAFPCTSTIGAASPPPASEASHTTIVPFCSITYENDVDRKVIFLNGT